MPKETRNSKPEASVLARWAASGIPRKPAKASGTGSGARMGGVTSDFGFRNSFGFRLSEFGFHEVLSGNRESQEYERRQMLMTGKFFALGIKSLGSAKKGLTCSHPNNDLILRLAAD
jgi:hypothetical protein